MCRKKYTFAWTTVYKSTIAEIEYKSFESTDSACKYSVKKSCDKSLVGSGTTETVV